MTSIDARIWDCFAQDNPYYHTVSWEAFRHRDRLDAADYWRSGQTMVDELLAFGEIPATDGLDALEIGCGIGRLTLPLSRRFRRVIGVDISAEMLRIAEAEAVRAGVTNLQLVRSDGRTLDGIESGSVDFVVSYVVFQHLSRRRYVRGYLNEAARVLRPGGRIVFQCPTWVFSSNVRHVAAAGGRLIRRIGAPRQALWAAMSYLVRRRIWRTMAAEDGDRAARARTAEEVRAASQHAARKMKSVYLPRLVNWLGDAGFVDIRIDRPTGVHACFAARLS